MPEDKGVPLAEIFTKAEINRLGFFKWLFSRRPHITTPQTPTPKDPPTFKLLPPRRH